MTTMELNVSPLGQVEGDLDVKVAITDGVVTDAWTEAAMFRGFEIILRGKDPQAGLIMTPRICGICGGSHLYKACYALDTAWGTYVPPNATRVRNIAQICETLQSIPRWFYAIMGPDIVAAQYSSRPLYEEVARRFAPYVGTSYQTGVTLSQHPVEIYAIFGGQWPHSSFMIPGGVMCAPTLSDITRSTRSSRTGRGSGSRASGSAARSTAGWRSRPGGRPGLDGRERVAAQQRPRVLQAPLAWRSASTSTARATATTWPPARSSTPTCTPTRRSMAATRHCSRVRASTPTASTSTSTRCGSPRT